MNKSHVGVSLFDFQNTVYNIRLRTAFTHVRVYNPEVFIQIISTFYVITDKNLSYFKLMFQILIESQVLFIVCI